MMAKTYFYGVVGVPPVLENDESVAGLEVDGLDFAVAPEKVLHILHGRVIREKSDIDLA